MKLDSPSRFTSFYESFSDLIFATMAIFVLLVVVFLTIIKSSGNSDELKQELAQIEKTVVEQSEKLAKAEFARDKAREQLKEMTTQLANLEEAVKAQGLELIIAVDVSGSMGDALGHLVETITTISKVLPGITPEFRVGIVAYRMGEHDSGPLQVFQLQQIHPESKDGGRSFSELSNFLGRLKASNGSAPVGLAVDKAINNFSVSFGGHQIFLLLGDVGPYESSLNDLYFNYQKRQNEVPIIRQVVSWVKGSDRRRVISLFSGVEPNRAWSEYQQRLEKFRESLRFFREVATQSGQPDNFTRNPGKMLAYLLTAIVKGK